MEQSDDFNEQLAAITQSLTSLQVQLTQKVENNSRHLASTFAAPPTEIQFWREHSFCYTYDEKFTPVHKCASKHYFLIQSVK